VEIPGNAPGISPAADNGWNSVYTSPCSGKVSKNGIAASVDRADFNGFFDEIAGNSNFTPGVYSSAPVWTSIFGTGGFSHIRHTFEWTYLGDTSSLSHTPRRLVPAEHQHLRAVLRRGDQFRQQRRDVAVVRRRRHLQRVR
jgi:hypothetical protein